jgi:hypothetical protein
LAVSGQRIRLDRVNGPEPHSASQIPPAEAAQMCPEDSEQWVV